jgi:hypothetical protein
MGRSNAAVCLLLGVCLFDLQAAYAVERLGWTTGMATFTGSEVIAVWRVDRVNAACLGITPSS